METAVATEGPRERALRALDRLPPFSPVLNRLVASLAREDVSFGEVAASIERDAVLAGNVLRVVNSSFYARRGTISSVRHAVSMMGQVKLRNTVLGLSVSQIWSRVRVPAGWPMAEWNRHSVAVGIFSDLLAERCGVGDAEGAFAAGLFHDLGKLLLAVVSEAEVDGLNHAHLSADALARWNIPPPVQEAVRFHHEPCPLELSHVVHLADRYVNYVGLSVPPAAPCDSGTESIFAGLGIDERQAPRIVEEFQTEFDAFQRVAC